MKTDSGYHRRTNIKYGHDTCIPSTIKLETCPVGSQMRCHKCDATIDLQPPKGPVCEISRLHIHIRIYTYTHIHTHTHTHTTYVGRCGEQTRYICIYIYIYIYISMQSLIHQRGSFS